VKTNRRQFLATAAGAAAAFTIVPRHVLGGAGFVPPSETVNVALVGAGGRALQNLRELFKEADCRVVAVADPAARIDMSGYFYGGVAGRDPAVAEIEKRYAETTPGFKCAPFEDFRRLYDEQKFDAVLCSTPDHSHAAVSVPAMRLGKHVYCEKPLTHNVWEARLMDKVAAETGVATQMGNQGHSGDGMRTAVEWIRAGVIGPVREVHAWAGAVRWNKSLVGAPESAAVPQDFNWDLWLGPREPRDYSPAYHPVAWRDFWDFGSGTLGDFGCHDMDVAHWALDLAAPQSVEARGAGSFDKNLQPHGEIVYYNFGSRGEMPPVRLTWYGGGLRPATPDEMPDGESLGGRGTLFVGEKGKILFGGPGSEPKLLGGAAAPGAPETIPRSKGHYRDWLDACKGGAPASSSFAYGAKLTELVLLGVASLRLGKPIEWDAAGMKAKGLPEADAVLNEPRRKGWELG